MSCLIDGPDYQYLSQEIRRLQIDDNKNIQESNNPISQLFTRLFQTQYKFQSFKAELKQKYNKVDSYNSEKMDLFSFLHKKNKQNSSQDDILEVYTEQQFQSCLNNTKLNNTFSIYSRISIKKDLAQIKITSTILKNGIPIQPKSKPFKLLLGRYFNRLNATFKDGTFRLNPFTGYIFFQLCSVLSFKKFDQFIFNSWAGLQYIQSELQISIQYTKFNFYKILYLIQEIPDDYIKYLQHNREKFRKFSRQQKTLQLIQKIIQCSSYEYDFMFSTQIRKNVPQNQITGALQNAQSRFDLVANNTYSINNRTDFTKLTKMFNYYNNVPKNIDPGKFSYKSTSNYFKDYQKNFHRHLMYPVSRNPNTNQKVNIFSQIYICNPDKIKWEIIGQGGFSKIQRGEVTYVYCKSGPEDKKQSQKNSINPEQLKNQTTLKKFLVKKTDKTVNTKISHQKLILGTIRQMYCINITKFYESTQPELKSSLLMDFYTSKSLQFYKRNNQQILSLLSRIYILIQTVQGIRFLRDNKIVHLDLKPQNLLIGKGLLLRITDFGESYHPQICFPQYRPGYTIPYAAPEVFQNCIPFNEKLDAFSMGMIMHQILFECFPLEVRRMSNQKIMSLYRSNNYIQMSLTTPQRTDAYGPKDLTALLCSLCLKCMSRNWIERPSLDWIQIILKESINYLDLLY